MSLNNGFIFKNIPAILFLILILSPQEIKGQENILDSIFSFSSGIVKTGTALNLITLQTGYNFSYDSRLINAEKPTEMNFSNIKLEIVLDSILKNDSLIYSVIDKFIIISKSKPPSRQVKDTIPAPELMYLSGMIIDGESGEALPFATIGFKNQGKGTVTNSNGEFGLKISPPDLNDTLIISYLGYYGRKIPVIQALTDNFTIDLRREFISIPEIIIKNQIPQDIIIKALSSIPKNYGNTPALLTGFYREGVMKRNKLQSYSEAILKIFKSPYSMTLLKDQINVFKSRKIENTSLKDTLTVRLKAGLSTSLQLDGAKHTFDFMDQQNMPDYMYRITDIVSLDDESAYEIEFSQREGIELPKFKGSVFINTSDFAILHAEFELTSEFLREMKDTFISNTTKGFRAWPVSAKYSVTYRKVNDRYFLSHVRGDLDFTARQQRRFFNSQFIVFFEMAVTSMNISKVDRFDREEITPIHSVFSRTITDYDPVFWGDQDFLRPEENLLQALKNMKVRLQEFSE
jgi:hypothetical protein